MAKDPTVWVIAFIDPKKMFTVERDMFKYKGRYRGCEAYIPQMKILVKQVKGQKHFETVPLLFNYAFFKVPKYYIPNSQFLDQMKKDIECIVGWVKDTAIRKNKVWDATILHNPLGVALAKAKDIANIRSKEEEKIFYTADDLQRLKKTKIITLHVYPFEGLPAEIIHIDVKKKKVKVRLLLDTSITELEVSFENVFYTIYKNGFEDKMREDYIDDLKDRNKGIDNALSFKNRKPEPVDE